MALLCYEIINTVFEKSTIFRFFCSDLLDIIQSLRLSLVLLGIPCKTIFLVTMVWSMDTMLEIWLNEKAVLIEKLLHFIIDLWSIHHHENRQVYKRNSFSKKHFPWSFNLKLLGLKFLTELFSIEHLQWPFVTCLEKKLSFLLTRG